MMKQHRTMQKFIQDFSDQTSTEELRLVCPDGSMHTRRDGIRYTELGEIKKHDWDNSANSPADFFEWLKASGAKPFGSVTGPLARDTPCEAVKIKSIFVRKCSNDLLEWGSTSRLKESSAWRHDMD